MMMGLWGFVSNSAFLDARQDDGFRKVVATEFNDIYGLLTWGNARTSNPKISGTSQYVFDIQDSVWALPSILSGERQGVEGFKVIHYAIEDYARLPEKVGLP